MEEDDYLATYRQIEIGKGFVINSVLILIMRVFVRWINWRIRLYCNTIQYTINSCELICIHNLFTL